MSQNDSSDTDVEFLFSQNSQNSNAFHKNDSANNNAPKLNQINYGENNFSPYKHQTNPSQLFNPETISSLINPPVATLHSASTNSTTASHSQLESAQTNPIPLAKTHSNLSAQIKSPENSASLSQPPAVSNKQNSENSASSSSVSTQSSKLEEFYLKMYNILAQNCSQKNNSEMPNNSPKAVVQSNREPSKGTPKTTSHENVVTKKYSPKDTEQTTPIINQICSLKNLLNNNSEGKNSLQKNAKQKNSESTSTSPATAIQQSSESTTKLSQLLNSPSQIHPQTIISQANSASPNLSSFKPSQPLNSPSQIRSPTSSSQVNSASPNLSSTKPSQPLNSPSQILSQTSAPQVNSASPNLTSTKLSQPPNSPSQIHPQTITSQANSASPNLASFKSSQPLNSPLQIHPQTITSQVNSASPNLTSTKPSQPPNSPSQIHPQTSTSQANSASPNLASFKPSQPLNSLSQIHPQTSAPQANSASPNLASFKPSQPPNSPSQIHTQTITSQVNSASPNLTSTKSPQPLNSLSQILSQTSAPQANSASPNLASTKPSQPPNSPTNAAQSSSVKSSKSSAFSSPFASSKTATQDPSQSPASKHLAHPPLSSMLPFSPTLSLQPSKPIFDTSQPSPWANAPPILPSSTENSTPKKDSSFKTSAALPVFSCEDKENVFQSKKNADNHEVVSLSKKTYKEILETTKLHGIIGSRLILSESMQDVSKTIIALAYSRLSADNLVHFTRYLHQYIPDIKERAAKIWLKELKDEKFVSALFKGHEKNIIASAFNYDTLYLAALYLSHMKLPKNFQFAPEMPTPYGWTPIEDFVAVTAMTFYAEKADIVKDVRLPFKLLNEKDESFNEWILKRVELITRELALLIPKGFNAIGNLMMPKQFESIECFKKLNSHVVYPKKLSINLQKKILRLLYLYGFPTKDGIEKIKILLGFKDNINTDSLLIFIHQILRKCTVYQPKLNKLCATLPKCASNKDDCINTDWIKSDAIQSISQNICLINEIRENFSWYLQNMQLMVIDFPEWNNSKHVFKWNYKCDMVLVKLIAYYGFLFNSMILMFIHQNPKPSHEEIACLRDKEIAKLMPITDDPLLNHLGILVNFKTKFNRIKQIIDFAEKFQNTNK